MTRRAFITLLGGALTMPARTIFAQPTRLPRVAMLSALAADDLQAKAREAAVRDGLRKLGWIDGRNVTVEVRFNGGSERLDTAALELIATQPDVIIAAATTALSALQKATTTIPIVFVQVTDPVGAGFVHSLARPGPARRKHYWLHAAGILNRAEMARASERVGTQHHACRYSSRSAQPSDQRILVNAQGKRPSLQGSIVRTSRNRGRRCGARHRRVRSRAEWWLDHTPRPRSRGSPRPDRRIRRSTSPPRGYPFQYWVKAGGLASYGIDNLELYRLAASYVDKILKGEKPAELPVQHSNKFQLAINLKTAKMLGIEPPLALLARTDDVIE